jgi:hypothetical protein
LRTNSPGPLDRFAAVLAVATAAALRTVPPIFRIGFDFATALVTRDVADPERGWLNGDYGRCSFDTFASAGAAIARFTSRGWISEVDPTEFGPAAFLADPSITFHTGDTVMRDGGYTIF